MSVSFRRYVSLYGVWSRSAEFESKEFTLCMSNHDDIFIILMICSGETAIMQPWTKKLCPRAEHFVVLADLNAFHSLGLYPNIKHCWLLRHNA